MKLRTTVTLVSPEHSCPDEIGRENLAIHVSFDSYIIPKKYSKQLYSESGV